MTAHWAFVIPIATGYLLRIENGELRMENYDYPHPSSLISHLSMVRITLLILTVFLFCWNIALYVQYLIL